ncbi:MAG: DUF975 family protein [Merdibacter sp.]
MLVVALEIMNYMVSVGFVIFSLHVSRDETAEIGNLFDGFGLFFRVLWLAILQGLFVSSVELAAGRTGYHRGLSLPAGAVPAARPPGEVRLAVPARERSGHARPQVELFVLDLSFFGWMLLSALFAPVSIWLDPYRAITNANYYNRLVGAQGSHACRGSFTDIPNDPQS